MRPIRCLVGRGALNRLTACRGSPLTSIQRSYATPAATPTPPINFKLHGFLAFSIFSASIGLFVWERRTATPVEGNAGESFSYYVKTASGRKDFIFARRSETETEAMLHENETSERIRRNGNPVIKWDQNWLGSNEPCEDRSAIDTIQRGPAAKATSLLSVRMVPETAGEGSRDLIMFSVLDGHGGDATSKLLAKALHPTIGLELASLQAGHLPRVREGGVKALAAYLNPLAWIGGKTWTSDNIVLSLQDA